MKAAQGMFRVIGGAIKGTPSSTQGGRTMDDLTAQIEAYMNVYTVCVCVHRCRCRDYAYAPWDSGRGLTLLACRPY